MKQDLSMEMRDLQIAAAKKSSQTDFDFHVGNWTINNRALRTRLKDSDDWFEFESTCETSKILSGFGNVNQYRFEKNAMPFDEGLVLRLFNPRTRLWTINWADSKSVVLDIPVIGSFEDKVGTFFSNDTFEDAPIIVRAVYDATEPDVVVWSQAFSQDKGKTFETNWIMTAHRQS
ncbi:MAG TPA: hypothetical protein VNB22_07955 [Pyrinomonadaceae bacterium]|nr:hypothetical protein [Pyrinomonadaceae bacterium]